MMFLPKQRISGKRLTLLAIYRIATILAVSLTDEADDLDFRVTSQGFTEVCFYWNELFEDLVDSEVVINVCQNEMPVESCVNLKAFLSDGKKCISLIDKRLTPYTNYNARIIVKGRELDAQSFFTPPLRPGKPGKVEISLHDDAYLISWLPPKIKNGAIDGYKLSFKYPNGKIHFMHTECNEFRIEKSHLPSRFEVHLQAFNKFAGTTLLGETIFQPFGEEDISKGTKEDGLEGWDKVSKNSIVTTGGSGITVDDKVQSERELFTYSSVTRDNQLLKGNYCDDCAVHWAIGSGVGFLLVLALIAVIICRNRVVLFSHEKTEEGDLAA